MTKSSWVSAVLRVEKPWGHEEHSALVDGRYCGKALHIHGGHALSLQYHEQKEETVAVQSGRLLFEAGNPNGKPDEEGHRSYLCPAEASNPVARCPLKSGSMRNQMPVKVRIQPTPDVSANPPKVCRQQTVTVAPEQGAKFDQSSSYGTEEWHDHYATLRSGIEGMNGYMRTVPTRPWPTPPAAGSTGWRLRASSWPSCSLRQI